MSWTLHEGDCLEIMPSIPDKSIDMILCDLPYGTTACKWDSIIPLDKLWEQYKRIIKDNAAIVLTASQPFTTKLIISNFEMFKYEWIWKKNRGLGFQHAQNMPIKQHENIVVFSKAPMGHKSLLGDKRMTYNPIGVYVTGDVGVIKNNKHGENLGARPNQVGREYQKRTGFPKSVLEVSSVTVKEGLHPTQKPVALFEYLIKTYTNPGDTVLDNCAGSGTTAVAAEKCGRNSILIEKESKYCQIIRDRMANLVLEEAMF